MPKKAFSKKKKLAKNRSVVAATPTFVRSTHQLASASKLLKQSVALLWANKKLFGGVLAIIGIVQLLVVQGIVQTDFVAMNQQVRDLVGTGAFGLGSGLLSYAYLLGSSGQSSGTGLIQGLFTVLTVLALLWTLREVFGGNKPRIRDAFYKSTYPLVSFVLVILWLGVQLLPALIGAWLYNVVTLNNIAVHMYEQLIWLAVCIALAIVSLHFMIGTTFALVIATLPDMTPLVAIRSAKNLVQTRRLVILRKLVFVGLALLIGTAVVLVPAIVIVPVIVPLLFYATSLVSLAILVTFIYSLYKELLQ